MVLWILIVVVGLLGFAILQMPDFGSDEPEIALGESDSGGSGEREDVSTPGKSTYEAIFGDEVFEGIDTDLDTGTELNEPETPFVPAETVQGASAGTEPEQRSEERPPVRESSAPVAESRSLTTPSLSAEYEYYDVQPGDSYSKISQRLYGTAKLWQEIQKANEDIPAERLKVGDRILIPKKHLISSRASLASANEPLSRRVPIESPRSSGTYVVQRGDTFYSIARRFGLSVDQLQALNRSSVSDPAQLKAGTVLRVP
ncbi:MAG: LysM peptidoglycan-binding domain-containing protein [Planctomycetota bacterium]